LKGEAGGGWQGEGRWPKQCIHMRVNVKIIKFLKKRNFVLVEILSSMIVLQIQSKGSIDKGIL
jgi:hypothetical protein